MTTAEKKYLELISQDEKDTRKADLAITAKKVHLDLQAQILEAQSQLENVKMRIESSKKLIPYSPSAEYELRLKAETLEGYIKFMEEVSKNRF